MDTAALPVEYFAPIPTTLATPLKVVLEVPKPLANCTVFVSLPIERKYQAVSPNCLPTIWRNCT